MKSKGFTVLELLIVVAMVGIIATILGHSLRDSHEQASAVTPADSIAK